MKIYLDLDGVLADFRKGLMDHFNDTEPHYEEIAGTNFFQTLDKFDSTDDLIDIIIMTFGTYNICSSPLRNDYENSTYHKTAWIKENLSPQPEDIIITKNKEKYARGNILIDDKESNIDMWMQKGGYGIIYKAWEHDLRYLIRELNHVADEIKDDRH